MTPKVSPWDEDCLHLAVLLRLQITLLAGNVLQQLSGLSSTGLQQEGQHCSHDTSNILGAYLLAGLDDTAAGGADLLGDLLTCSLGVGLGHLLLLELALLDGPLFALLTNVDDIVRVILSSRDDTSGTVRDTRCQLHTRGTNLTTSSKHSTSRHGD